MSSEASERNPIRGPGRNPRTHMTPNIPSPGKHPVRLKVRRPFVVGLAIGLAATTYTYDVATAFAAEDDCTVGPMGAHDTAEEARAVGCAHVFGEQTDETLYNPFDGSTDTEEADWWPNRVTGLTAIDEIAIAEAARLEARRVAMLARDLSDPSSAAFPGCLELESLPECAARLASLGVPAHAELVEQACWLTVGHYPDMCDESGWVP